jgi:ASCH domain
MTEPLTIPDGLLALSIKQPWAALVVAGVKTIEIRTWPTGTRGPVLIHTGRTPDPRPEGWHHITTPELQEMAKLSGGILGLATLVACRTYESAGAFAADALLHRNAPTWFVPPRLYGFEFANPRPLPFRRQSGKLFFFPVDGIVVPPPELPELGSPDRLS